MPRELSTLNEKVLRVERKVSQLWRGLPWIAQGAFLRNLLMNEIASTNEIEGVHSTRRQIEEALESAESQSPSNKNKRFKEFARLYLELTNKTHVYPKTPVDIREIYDAVMVGELANKDKPDGKLFRKDGVEVMAPTQEVLHRGVTPESKIVEMLEQMIGLIDSSEIPATYAALISHFLFEYIHPFYDGNGRTGRYLLALYLSEPLSLPTVLSLSATIADNKGKYYKAFSEAEDVLNHGEVTFFVIQMLELIRLAQDSVMESLETYKLLLEKTTSLVEELKAGNFLSDKAQRVLGLVAQHTLFAAGNEVSIQEIAQSASMSAQTARKYTQELEEEDLLKATSVKPLRFKLTQRALDMIYEAEG